MIRTVFSLAVLFVSFGYARADTPNTIAKFSDTPGVLADSVITEDPVTGNVGIGTSSPGNLLQLNKEGDYAQVGLFTYEGTNPDISSFLVLFRARGTAASPAAVLSGDLLGGLQFGGHDGIQFAGRGDIIGSATQDWSPTGWG